MTLARQASGARSPAASWPLFVHQLVEIRVLGNASIVQGQAVRGLIRVPASRRSPAAIKNAGLDALHRVRAQASCSRIGAAIAAICIAGVLLGHERDVAIFALLEERTLTPLFTAFLLVAAAGLALAARRTGAPMVWLAIAGFLLAMAGDELFSVHESLRSRLWSGPSSYLVFIPYAALGAYIWLQVLRRLRGHRSAAALWVGGAALWGASRLLDAFAVLDESASAGALPPIEVVEEGFEMAGSALFLLALLVFSATGPQAERARRSPDARRHPSIRVPIRPDDRGTDELRWRPASGSAHADLSPATEGVRMAESFGG